MAMSITSGSDGAPMVDMNTTPLIDVMLVLLIMFIITLPVMTNSINLELPLGSDSIEKPEVVNLGIEFDGTIVWNGAVVESIDQLERYLRTEAGKADQAELHVRPDRRAKYDDVARVLAMAQRNGIRRIGFAGQERFID